MSDPEAPESPVSPAAILAAADEIELEIEKLVDGGDGLGRYRGVPIFVPRAAPGDLLRVRISERRPRYGRAEITEILRPGPDRREPPCPFFERCGGCDLQHLEDPRQVELKVAAARETLRRLGGFELPERQRVVAGEAWGYRLRTQLQVQPGESRGLVGYFARRSRDLVSVDRCPVLVPELEEVLPKLPLLLGGSAPRRLDLAAADGTLAAAPVVEGLPHGEIRLEVAGAVYAFDARTFFQGHRGLLEPLVESVVGDREGGTACDLFAGVGLFSVPLARRYRRVVAVEGDRVAARYARKNARLNDTDGLEVEAMAVESWVTRLAGDVDRVVVDPPRPGLPLGVRGVLADRRPRRITYVSCHPAALARDLKALIHFYEVEELTYLDLFPQTGHLEVVAQLLRRDSYNPPREDVP